MSETVKAKKPQVTTMAAAMMKGLQSCIKEGRNSGALGGHIVRAASRGVGIKGNGHTVHTIKA